MTGHRLVRETEAIIADWARGEGYRVDNASGQILIEIGGTIEAGGETISATSLAEAIERRLSEVRP